MQYLPVDITAVIATTLGLMCFLVPVCGFTLRFALKPVVEALSVAWSRNASKQEIAILEKRIALLEHELELRRLPAVSQVGEVGEVGEAPAVGASVAPLRGYERT